MVKEVFYSGINVALREHATFLAQNRVLMTRLDFIINFGQREKGETYLKQFHTSIERVSKHDIDYQINHLTSGDIQLKEEFEDTSLHVAGHETNISLMIGRVTL